MEEKHSLEEILKRNDIPEDAKVAINSLFQKMEFLALHDPMTGLYNRLYYDNEISKLEKDRKEYPLTAIMLDIDNLKAINDKYGHAEGDLAIKYVGQLLNGTFRETDLKARIGGDEFIAVLPKFKDYNVIEKDIKKIREKISEYRTSFEINLSVSIGTATGSNKKISNVIKQADQQMYAEKMEHSNGKIYLLNP